MQIVIDIPIEWLFDMKNKKFCQTDSLYQKILNGTPLPEGHGKIMDADKYRHMWVDTFDSCYGDACAKLFKDSVDYAPAIIEADKESEGEK